MYNYIVTKIDMDYDYVLGVEHFYYEFEEDAKKHSEVVDNYVYFYSKINYDNKKPKIFKRYTICYNLINKKETSRNVTYVEFQDNIKRDIKWILRDGLVQNNVIVQDSFHGFEDCEQKIKNEIFLFEQENGKLISVRKELGDKAPNLLTYQNYIDKYGVIDYYGTTLDFINHKVTKQHKPEFPRCSGVIPSG